MKPVIELIDTQGQALHGLLDLVPEAAISRPATEAGLAEAFSDFFSEGLAFIPETGKWSAYDGARWKTDDQGTSLQAVKLLLRALSEEARARGDMARAALLASFERVQKMAAIRTFAATEPKMVRPLALFDADPWALNTPGGLLNIRAGTLTPHDPAQNVSKVTTVFPDFDKPPTLFNKFLREISAGREGLAAWLLLRLGYEISGDTRLQDFEIRWGGGRNGKGTLERLQRNLYGDYAGTSPVDTFLSDEKGHTGGPAPEILDLRGRRVTFSNETGDGDFLNTTRVKTLTGEDEQACRALFSNIIVHFTPTTKIVLSTNNQPSLKKVDDAIKSRVKMVPFDVKFVGDNRNPKMFDDLMEEGPSILGAIIRAAKVYAETLTLPDCEEVATASEKYILDQDPVASWLAACCTLRPGVKTPAEALYRSFKEWQIADGKEHLWTQTRFGRALESHGVKAFRTAQGKIREGVELLRNV